MEENRSLGPPDLSEDFEELWESVRNSPVGLRIGIVLLIVGLVLAVGGAGFFGWTVFVAGGLTAATSLAQEKKLGFLRIAAPDEVVDQWSTLINGAQDEPEAVLEDVAKRIHESEAPNIRMERRNVAPGWVRGMLGGTRSFLIVLDREHPNLKNFRMYINARPYGQNLQVNWY